MTRYKFEVPRIPAVERDGKLFAGDVRVYISEDFSWHGTARLFEDTREGLRLWDHARLIKCRQCGGKFIGHHAARLCSQECIAAAKKLVQRKAIEKRSKLRSWVKEHGDARRCKICDREMYGTRKTRKYCSNACRQAAYRKL